MECLLLLVDEMDDWISTLRLHWVGVRRSIGLIILGALGAAALLGIAAIGLAPLLLCAFAIGASALLAFGFRLRTAPVTR